MNFQVPQFIETEDKIVGPLTLRQFLYIASGAGLSFILFFFLNTGLWIFFTFFIAMIAVSFAFIRVNGRPLSVAFLYATKYYWKPRKYLWQRETKILKAAAPKLPETESKISQLKSRLDSLWEQLKTSKEPIPKREKKAEPSILDRTKSSKERFEMMRKITGEREMARRVDYR